MGIDPLLKKDTLFFSIDEIDTSRIYEGEQETFLIKIIPEKISKLIFN